MAKFVKNNLPFFLSLSDGFLQLISVYPKKDLLKIESAGFGKIPLDALQGGEIVQKKLAGEMIITLINNSQPKGISSNFCYVNLPDKFVFSKFLSLPKVKEEELEQAIQFKIKNFLPHKPEEMYIDWQLLTNNGANKGPEISLVAVERRIIDSYLDVFKAINIFPLSFEPESFSLARLAAFSSPDPTLVIYLNERTATFSFVEKGGVLFVNTLDLSLANKNDKELLEELTKSAKFWQTTFAKTKTIKNVYLAGLVEKELAITQAANKNFKAPVKKLPLPVIVPSGITQNRVKRLSPLFGLALFQMKPDIKRKRISLIPDKVKKEREDFSFKKRVESILKITNLILFVFLATYLFVFLSIFFQLEKTKASLSGWKKMIFTPTQIELEKKSFGLNQKLISLDKILKKRQVISPLLLDFVDQLVVGIVVDEFSFNSSKQIISIKGKANSREDILALEKSLSKLGQVTIPLSSFEESQNTRFSATIKLK